MNFALGAQAMFPAVVYAELRTSGDLLLPVIGIPNRYGIGDPLGLWPAAIMAMVVGAAISVAAYLLIFRPLRDAPPLTLIVATVGLTIILQGLAVKSFGTQTVRTPSILPRDSVTVFGHGRGFGLGFGRGQRCARSETEAELCATYRDPPTGNRH